MEKDDWSNFCKKINEIAKSLEDEGNAISISSSYGDSYTVRTRYYKINARN